MHSSAAGVCLDPRESCLEEFRRLARTSPHAAALVADDREALRYAELAREMDAVAARLAQAGITASDVVAVNMPDGPEAVPVLLGALSTAICAPLNPNLKESETRDCLERLGASVLITEPGRITRTGLASRDPRDAVLLLHTSATTGRPKVVPLTHANLAAMMASTVRVLELASSDRLLGMMPLFHLQGLISLIAGLCTGGSVIQTRGFDAARFPRWMKEHRPTWYTAGPALHSAILACLRADDELRQVRSVRLARSVGAALPPAVQAELEQLLGAPVLDGYGLTEAGLVSSHTVRDTRRPAGSVGRVMGPECAIVGANGAWLPPGEDGEIVLRGPSVMAGYWHNPEANAQAFHQGWFRTGDLGRLDEDGFLYVTGRLKEMINRGGEKVLPLEVEEALAAHPAVVDAAVFGVPHPTLGEDVAAAVVLRSEVSPQQLRRFTADRIAAFKTPRRIYFVEAIPKGATGKPKRLALAETLRGQTPYVGAHTPVQVKLVEIWKRVLFLKQVGIDDDFFELGGDSFAMALMLTEVEAEFEADRRRLDESPLLAEPTVRELARILAEPGVRQAGRPRGSRSPIVTLQPEGTRTPFFCFPGADENPYYFRRLAQSLGADQPFYVVRDPRPLAERGVYTLEEEARRFLEDVRSVQPRGPYALGGHCYGGIIAFEMARQLAAQGEDVALVALFEVAAPGYPKVVRHWRRYLAALRSLRRVTFAQVAEHARVVAGIARRRASQAALRLGLVRKVPLEQVNLANARAVVEYVPRELRCRVVQFLSRDQPHSFSVLQDPRRAWAEIVKGEFSVREVSGMDTDLFVDPHVAELAAQLREELDRAYIK